jgi:hypothetical protein
MIARETIKAQLRADGVRVTLVLPRHINECATAYLSQHPEVWRVALERAHRIDDKEGQRKEKRKLRREELRQRRPVNQIATNRALKRLNFLVQLLRFSEARAY